MPATPSPRLALLLVLVLAVLPAPGCGSASADINIYLHSLNVAPDSLLNVQETGPRGVERQAQGTESAQKQEGLYRQSCTRTTYSLHKNMSDIAVLRPSAGVLWPGALVRGNASLLDGMPEPLPLLRAPMTLRVDLPGMEAQGTRRVEAPSYANVQTAIDEALEWWNANAYHEGYVNASQSSFQLSSSYSSEQLALDVGLSASWAQGDVSAQLSYASSETRRVVMAVYKQAFYTVSYEAPASPELAFAGDVTLADVQQHIDAGSPPAYVASVTYGRLLMARMETTEQTSAVDAEAAFRYAMTSSNYVKGDLSVQQERILQRSSIQIVTLGGNAAVATKAINTGSIAQIVQGVQAVIQGDNAVYSRSNPGVPITYTVRYLHDNSLARLGYATEYTATECTTEKTRDTITVTLDRFYVHRDCDGIEGDGDFALSAVVKNGKSQMLKVSRSRELGDKSSDMISQNVSFDVDRVNGRSFSVAFGSTEWDTDVLGRNFRDSRMDKESDTITHKYHAGRWSNRDNPKKAPIKIKNGSGKCQAELWYRVKMR